MKFLDCKKNVYCLYFLTIMASTSRIEANKVVCYAHPDAPLIEDYRAGDMICSECGLVVGDR
ncbi:hypothetical protein O3G_MSEX000759 [Manduca sexta]|nr:hypothetical protein O3G_MSEX000759 [Manduca sexta]